MNDRIQQLAEQAGFDQHHAEYDTCIKQFAELIVAECARLCDNHGNKVEDARPNKDLSSAAFDCSDIIREHFGVE